MEHHPKETALAAHYNNRAVALQMQGNRHEAVIEYRRALQIDRNHVSALSNLGFLLIETGQSEEAVLLLQRAIGCDPTYAAAHNNLGLAYLQLDQLEQAQAAAIERRQAGARAIVTTLMGMVERENRVWENLPPVTAGSVRYVLREFQKRKLGLEGEQ